ncbi:hypothetical protein [Nonomuraea sp. NPDC049480]|uniref:hypothetical protein n=1 Tax=Nonomuraea sp. NPDC049480 TaxID=3364353 RepID=UPI0037A98A70
MSPARTSRRSSSMSSCPVVQSTTWKLRARAASVAARTYSMSDPTIARGWEGKTFAMMRLRPPARAPAMAALGV